MPSSSGAAWKPAPPTTSPVSSSTRIPVTQGWSSGVSIETPEDQPWVTGILVDDETGEVVGGAGFHAAPEEDGMVEVGYGIDPAYRRRGYARAALLLMIERARSEPSASVFRVTVSPDNAASLGLVAQLPFVAVGEQWDDEDGLETIFELPVQGQRRAAT